MFVHILIENAQEKPRYIFPLRKQFTFFRFPSFWYVNGLCHIRL